MAISKVYEGIKTEKVDSIDWEEVKADNSIWIPEKEADEVEGLVVNISDEGGYGNQHELITKDKNHIKTPSHKALQKILEKINIGDYIKIIYKGEKPSGKGNPVQIYSVWMKPVKKKDSF